MRENEKEALKPVSEKQTPPFLCLLLISCTSRLPSFTPSSSFTRMHKAESRQHTNTTICRKEGGWKRNSASHVVCVCLSWHHDKHCWQIRVRPVLVLTSLKKKFSPWQTETTKGWSRLSRSLIAFWEFHSQNISVWSWYETIQANVCFCVLMGLHPESFLMCLHVCMWLVSLCMQCDLEPSQPSRPAQHLASYLSFRTSVMNKHYWKKKWSKMKITEWNLEKPGSIHSRGGVLRKWMDKRMSAERGRHWSVSSILEYPRCTGSRKVAKSFTSSSSLLFFASSALDSICLSLYALKYQSCLSGLL